MSVRTVTTERLIIAQGTLISFFILMGGLALKATLLRHQRSVSNMGSERIAHGCLVSNAVLYGDDGWGRWWSAKRLRHTTRYIRSWSYMVWYSEWAEGWVRPLRWETAPLPNPLHIHYTKSESVLAINTEGMASTVRVALLL